MSSIPTARSRKHLQDMGYHVETVEKWNHITQRRHDLFGFGDLLAIRENEVVVIQTTSASNMSSRIRKITLSPLLDTVRKAGIRIIVHGWKKLSTGRYTLKEMDLS